MKNQRKNADPPAWLLPGCDLVQPGADTTCSTLFIGAGVGFERPRRITGYISPLERWGNAKRAEERDRVKHGLPNNLRNDQND